MAMAAKTWTGQWWKWGGGGEPWNAFAYDAANNQILFGVGNGYPWNREIRSPGGDNLFLCSIVAVDADTGEYRWHYQFNAGDSWDYDATMDIELADLKIGGKLRQVAMEAPKNGYFYVFDRTDGKLLSAGQIAAKLTWAKGIDMRTGRPIEVSGIHYQDGKAFEMWPSPRGAHSWMPMAFSPQTGLVYIPRLSQGLTFDSRGIDAGENLRVLGANIGAAKPDPLDETSALIAWNPVTQKLVWEVPTFGGWNGGVLATGGDLVFQGQINGRFSAYEARHGKELWHFAAQDALLAAPISYMVGGKQYVSVVVGMTGTAAIDPRESRRPDIRLLDPEAAGADLRARQQCGTAARAPPPVIQAAPDPDYKPDAALAAKGAAAFGFNCGICHGPEAVSGGTAPELRSSDTLSARGYLPRGGARRHTRRGRACQASKICRKVISPRSGNISAAGRPNCAPTRPSRQRARRPGAEKTSEESTMHFKVEQLPGRPEFGAIVRDLAPESLSDPATRKALYDLWIDRGVIIFKNMEGINTHLELSSVFGEPEEHPLLRGVDMPREHKLIIDIADGIDVRRDGTIDYESEESDVYEIDGELRAAFLPWHSDLVYVDEINHGGIIRPVTLPKNDGQTGFIDQIEAYSRLPRDLAERIENLSVIYRYVVDASKAKYGWVPQKCLKLRDQADDGREAQFGQVAIDPPDGLCAGGYRPQSAQRLAMVRRKHRRHGREGKRCTAARSHQLLHR